ncbi:hypothetical protein D3C87_1460620 [compost metagenome]
MRHIHARQEIGPGDGEDGGEIERDLGQEQHDEQADPEDHAVADEGGRLDGHTGLEDQVGQAHALFGVELVGLGLERLLHGLAAIFADAAGIGGLPIGPDIALERLHARFGPLVAQRRGDQGKAGGPDGDCEEDEEQERGGHGQRPMISCCSVLAFSSASTRLASSLK